MKNESKSKLHCTTTNLRSFFPSLLRKQSSSHMNVIHWEKVKKPWEWSKWRSMRWSGCESNTSLLLPLNFKGSLWVSIVSKSFFFICFFNFQLSVTLFVIKVVFCFAMFACVVLHMISLSVYELRLSVGYAYFNGSLTWAAEDLQASL